MEQKKLRMDILHIYAKFILNFDRKKHDSLDLLKLPEYAHALYLGIDNLIDQDILNSENLEDFPAYLQNCFNDHHAITGMDHIYNLLQEFDAHFKVQNLEKFIKKSFVKFKQISNQMALFENNKTAHSVQ